MALRKKRLDQDNQIPDMLRASGGAGLLSEMKVLTGR